MTTLDGTQERTLDPPDLSLSDAELRECERAAREGFDAMDERSSEWLNDQLADTPVDIAATMKAVIRYFRQGPFLGVYTGSIRNRYIAECAEDYWPDLMDQAAHAQEP